MNRLAGSSVTAVLLVSAAIVGLAAPAAAQSEAVLPLGAAATLEHVFPCELGAPPAPGAQPTPPAQPTLAESIQHYLEQSATRDGLRGATVEVQVSGGAVKATLRSASPIPPDYQARVAAFLAIGAEAYQGALALQQAGTWDAKRWRFLLPLGLPLVNQRSVQLMHFPPDYTLTTHDYLDSRTSRRWEALLRANGVPKADLVLDEDIVDIAPVAAPASAGDALTGTYGAFKTYTRHMLAFALAPRAGGARPLPLLAYGHPVRAWVESEFGVALGVLSLGSITLDGGQAVPVLGANHPSFIWYAAQQANARPLAMKVMKQDLIAACWQAAMTRGTAPDATAALAWCTAKWNARPRDVCVLTETEAFNTPLAQARKACSATVMKRLLATPEISDEEAAGIERAAPLNGVGR